MGGQCWESIAKMADACKMSQQKVKDSLNLLADAQLIRKIRRPGKSDVYELLSEVYWVDAKHLEALRKEIRSYREPSDQKRKALYQQQANYDVVNYVVVSTELRRSYPPSYDVANTELRRSYKDLRNTQEVITPEVTPPKSKSEGEIFSQEIPEAANQSSTSLTSKADVKAANDVVYRTRESAAACDNNAFVGHGNHAPDGNVRPFDQRKAVWKSICSDPWMQSSQNPLPEFKQWLYERYQAHKKNLGLADAASEIRNDYARASDLWQEYQGERLNRATSVDPPKPAANTEEIAPSQARKILDQLRNKAVK
jgi:hypothetical protein